MFIFRRILFLSIILTLPLGLFALTNEPTTGPTPAESLEQLKKGNDRYVLDKLTHPHSGADRRLETAKGQKPYATILGCSDSRANLELIFDAGIGDLFVIRVAGNVADTDEIATIEYGSEHLKTPLIVVLGHTSCGAVTAVVSGAELSGSLPGLLDNILPASNRAWKTLGKEAKQSEVVQETVKENTLQSMEDILRKSPIVTELIKEGKVKLIGAVYHLDSGSIDWLGEHPRQAAIISEPVAPHEKPTQPVSQTPVSNEPPTAKPSLILSLFAVFFIPAMIVIFFYALLMVFFINEKRVVKDIKILGRLICSFLSISIVFAGAIVYASLIPDSWSGNLPKQGIIGIAIVVTVFYSVIFSLNHVKAFRNFFQKLKEKNTAEGS